MIWDLIIMYFFNLAQYMFVFFLVRPTNNSFEFIVGMLRNPLCRKLFQTIFRTDSSPTARKFFRCD